MTSAPTDEDMADAEEATAETFTRPDLAGVAVVDGWGCRVRVDSGKLEASDGFGEVRRTRSWSRATHGLSRLVVLAQDGALTLSALRWCRSLGVGVLVLGSDGTPIFTSTPRLTDDARLRRAQALAPLQPVGLDIARHLLAAKVRAQAGTVSRFVDQAGGVVRASYKGLSGQPALLSELAEAIEAADSIEDARALEAEAAGLYFALWAGRADTAPHFAPKDRGRVPAHWRSFESRRSVLKSANGNRKAERPVNALLNYCFGLLEAEAVLACAAVGLDPGLGVVHQDAKARQSMALDLMEPVRPAVEGFVLDMLAARTFRKRDFTEAQDGHVRLLPPLTHELAATLPRWAKLLAPLAEKVAHMLGESMEGKYVATTPLTTARHRAAQAAIKARKASARQRAGGDAAKQRSGGPAPAPLWSCPRCGGAVSNPRHVLCLACQERSGHTAAVRQTRGRAIAARKRALAELEVSFGADVDPAIYREHIWPKLQAVKLSALMEATGYSKGYCSALRAGKWAPKVSTWPALATLVGLDLAEVAPGERGGTGSCDRINYTLDRS